MVFGVAIAVIGAGLTGGLYSSYSNYQSLATIYNITKKDVGSNINGTSLSLDDFIKNWNKNLAKLTDNQKNQANQLIETEKENWYKSYPTYNDYENNMLKSGYTKDQIQDNWNQQTAYFSVNYNYDANQDGVIAGSVLLAIGLAAYIVFSVIFLVIWKKEKKTS